MCISNLSCCSLMQKSKTTRGAGPFMPPFQKLASMPSDHFSGASSNQAGPLASFVRPPALFVRFLPCFYGFVCAFCAVSCHWLGMEGSDDWGAKNADLMGPIWD
jgi:hypothetical protein